MTKEQVDELIKKAKSYIGKEISLQIEYDTSKEKYIFVDTGTLVTMSENEKTNYGVGGILKRKDGSLTTHNLYFIVKEFEKL